MPGFSCHAEWHQGEVGVIGRDAVDHFIRSLNRRVKLLKVDIEGSEICVINRLIDTGTIDLVDLVVVETRTN